MELTDRSWGTEMTLYGFKDKRIADNLKRLGMASVKSADETVGVVEGIDNGSRIYLVKPTATIPAATLSGTTLTPGQGTVEVYEIDDSGEAVVRTNGESTGLECDAYNVGFTEFPATAGSGESESFCVAVEDSFGRFLLVSPLQSGYTGNVYYVNDIVPSTGSDGGYTKKIRVMEFENGHLISDEEHSDEELECCCEDEDEDGSSSSSGGEEGGTGGDGGDGGDDPWW